MAYRVDISLAALQDAEDAYLWILRRAPTNAGAWYEGLLKVVYGLEQNPTRCPIAPESEDIGMLMPQRLYGKKKGVYRILFAVGYDDEAREDVVRVLRIRHSARLKATPEELFEGEEKREDDE